jgi:predicted permease
MPDPDWKERLRRAYEASGESCDADTLEELSTHAAAEYDDLCADGASRVEAEQRVDALINLWASDAPSLRRPEKRESPVPPPSGGTLPAGLIKDFRYGIRLLRRQPGYAAIAILTIALGIGAATTLYSIAYGVLIKPLPWPQADRLMRVTESRKGQPGRVRGTISNGSYLAWRDNASTIEAIGGYGLGSGDMTVVANGGEPARVRVGRLTASMFQVLRAGPLRGRVFETADEPSGGTGQTPPSRVALLSYGLWLEWFGGRDEAIGAVVRFDDRPMTIVGIMPREFAFPNAETRAWLPMPIAGVLGDQGVPRMTIFSAMARLKPGVTPEQASAEGTSRARSGPDSGRAAVGLFGSSAPPDLSVAPAVEAITADVRPGILVLLAAVALLLATATANVGSIQLARATTRRRELAIRAAIGASRRRLLAQLVLESTLVGLAGGLVGIALATIAVQALPSVLPPDFPRLAEIRVSGPVMAFVAVLMVATTIVCGLLPSLEITRVDLSRALGTESAASTEGRRSRGAQLRAAIMVAQVAVACLLLVGAVLLGRSFVALMGASRGFDPANVLSARVNLPPRYTGADRVTLADRIIARLNQAPGVSRAAAGNALPFVSLGGNAAFRMPSPIDPGITLQAQSLTRIVSTSYCAAMSLHLIAGRWLLDSDTATTRPVLVVNRSFAQRYLADPPVGAQVPMFFGEGRSQAEVVGVVDDMRQADVTDPPAPEVFASYEQLTGSGLQNYLSGPLFLMVRTTDDPIEHVGELRMTVRELDPTIALDSVMTMQERVAASLGNPRFYAAVLVAFGVFALLIAAVGLFGVLSFSVAQRTREIGMRSALGAQTRDIIVLMLRQAFWIVTGGVAIGLAAVWASGRLLSRFLYGIHLRDPLTFVLVPVVVVVVAAVACIVPARRAARVDPLTALRSG